jgi:hypothetical protein
MTWIHVGAHEQEFLGGHEIGSAEPLVVGPSVGLTKSVGDLDETAFSGRHSGAG